MKSNGTFCRRHELDLFEIARLGEVKAAQNVLLAGENVSRYVVRAHEVMFGNRKARQRRSVADDGLDFE